MILSIDYTPSGLSDYFCHFRRRAILCAV